MTAQQANNLYSLPSMPKCIANLHAFLGFPTKAAMLDAAAAGRLTGIPFATVANIREHYLRQRKRQKGTWSSSNKGSGQPSQIRNGSKWILHVPLARKNKMCM